MEKHYSNGGLPAMLKKTLSSGESHQMLEQFKGIASVSLNDGKTYVLWLDLWNGHVNC